MRDNDKTKDELLQELKVLKQENISLKESLDNGIIERKLPETHSRLIAHVQDILLHPCELDDIYKLVSETTKQLIGDGITATSILDEKHGTLRMTYFSGLDIPLDKVLSIIGFDPWHKEFPLDAIAQEDLGFYRYHHLGILSGGLYALMTRLVPKPACLIIERLLRVQKVYGMGFIHQEAHMGGLVILARNDITQHIATIEQIVNMATIAIERKRAEEALRQSEELLSLFMKFSPIYSFIKEVTPSESRVLKASENFQEVVGIPVSELFGKTMEEVYPPEFAAKISADDWNVVSTGKMIELEEELNGRFYTTLKYPIAQGGKSLLAGYAIDITERKQAEALFQDIIDKNPMSIQIVDKEGFTLTTNSAHTLLFGVAPPVDFSIFTDLKSKGLGDSIQIAMNGEVVHLPDLYYNVHDIFPDFPDKPVWIRAVLFPLKDSNDKPQRFVFMHEDITEKKRAELSLHENVLKYRTLFETADDAILLFTDGTWVDCNTGALKVYGCTREQIIGAHPSRFSPPLQPDGLSSEKEAIRKIDLAFAGEPQFFEWEHIRLDGTPFEAEVKLNRLDLGGKPFIQAIVRDVSERKKAQEALNESAGRYRSILETAMDGFWLTDMQGRFLQVNEMYCRMSGYTEQELLTMRISDVESFETADDTAAHIKKVMMEGEDRFETKHHRKEGSTFDLEASVQYQNYKGGQIVCFFHDITERKQYEKELIIAKEKAEESDRLKSSFLANMSHEIRTPMNGILGFAELLKEPELTGEEQQNFIAVIERSGARMLNTINDIISISKIESGESKITASKTNMNEQMEYLRTFFIQEAEQKGLLIKIRNLLPVEEAWIETDHEKVFGILTNLIKNAIKFTNKGSVEIGCEKKGNYLEFFVKDTGSGIRPERRDVIFERFRQGDELLNRPYEGAGLGLSISKGYVEMLGGKIWVESEMGRGSTFYFTIPCITETAEKVEADNTFSTEELTKDMFDDQSNKLKTLIAEDDEASEMFLTIASAKFSREVLIARTGIDTIQLCLDNPDLDLILMDIRMPGMNGYEATRQIRQFNKEVIIIAQTAFAMTGEREKALEAGCNDYISKPIKQAELNALIRQHCLNINP